MIPPLISSAGLNIVGISEPGKKSDNLVRVDGAAWQNWCLEAHGAVEAWTKLYKFIIYII